MTRHGYSPDFRNNSYSYQASIELSTEFLHNKLAVPTASISSISQYWRNWQLSTNQSYLFTVIVHVLYHKIGEYL